MPTFRTSFAAFLLCLCALSGCSRHHIADHPRLAAGTRASDITLHSDALQKTVKYRVIFPSGGLPSGAAVVYLLHGARDDETSWSNDSDVSALAQQGLLLVMPNTEDSLLVNEDRGKPYEDYFLKEVMPSVHVNFPQASTSRERTAIVGISRGGFSAMLLALKYPGRFAFAAALSPALDMAERYSTWKHPFRSLQWSSTFGPRGGEHRRANDPMLLAGAAQPGAAPMPYIYLACGASDWLLAPTERFSTLLDARGVRHTSVTADGGHSWDFWNAQLPALEASLLEHLDRPTTTAAPRQSEARP